MSDIMKAMQLTRFAPIEQKPLELKDFPVPEPGQDEILIKISVCGVCHTDLHAVEGELPEPLGTGFLRSIGRSLGSLHTFPWAF